MHDSNPEQLFAGALQAHQSGQLAQAEQLYRRILQLDPGHSDALHFLGVIAFQSGNLEPALELVQRSVALRPDGAVYRNNLGQILERMGRNAEAEQAYEAAIELDAEYAEPCNNLGHLLHKQDRLAEAQAQLRKAIELNPDYAEPYTNLGNLLKDSGDLDAAIQAYRQAIALNPGLSFLHSNLLLTLHYHPDYSPADLLREHRAWAERHVKPLQAEQQPHSNEPAPNRRLRIGYVSPDFREHPIARFILPVLQQHDPEKFEVFAYADIARADEVTETIRPCVQQWRQTNTLSDEQLAAQIREDRIDILIDLAAHSGGNRLLTFARKPAPIQASWLAYCSTTGVDAIDYRLTDRFLDPPDTDLTLYSEQSIRLPHCYWCYSPPQSTDAETALAEREDRPPTFGCLNNFAKVTAPTLRLWTQLLLRMPEAQLVLYAPPGSQRERVSSMLHSQGVSMQRVRFVSRQSIGDYLETWRGIDVALDPFPYCGGTTTCDALWMGVPVVSLRGSTAVSRAGSSLLCNAGLGDLVAGTESEYLDIACALIEDTQRLTDLRQSLRERMQASPLMDARQFTRDLEAAYADMWKTWREKHA